MSTETETNLNKLIETTVKEVLDQRLQTLVEEKLQGLRKKESRPKRVANIVYALTDQMGMVPHNLDLISVPSCYTMTHWPTGEHETR